MKMVYEWGYRGQSIPDGNMEKKILHCRAYNISIRGAQERALSI
jgi:hypothetical protein